MANLNLFWQWLEVRPSRTAVMAEWRDVADGLFPMIKPMLQPIDRQTASYPNPYQGCQPMKVVRHNDGTIVAIDEDDWENRLELRNDDIILYQINLRVLRSMLCNILDGVNIAKTHVDQATRTLQIGNLEPKKSAMYPVYLLMCQHRYILREQVMQLMVKRKHPGVILLTPSRMNWDNDIDILARSGKMLLVPLSEIIAADRSAFTETIAWEDYLQGFAKLIALTLPSNYRNKKPVVRRAPLMAKVEKVKNALKDHILSARDGVVANIDAEKGVQLVRYLSKTDLAKLAGVEPYHITRCFTADPQLKKLYQIANDPEDLLRYGR